MHQSLLNIQQELSVVVTTIRSAISSDEPFGIAHGNWSFPGLTRTDLIMEAQSIIDLIEDQGADDVGENEPLLADYIRRLKFIQSSVVPNLWGSPANGVAAYNFTLNGLRAALEPVLTRDGHRDAVLNVRKLKTNIRGLESTITGLTPRTASISKMLDTIEGAYNAADQLPTDLESLTEAKQKVSEILDETTKRQTQLKIIQDQAETIASALKSNAIEAAAVLKRCETAYSAATNVGLAAAFSERSSSLARSMWVWVTGLIVALAAAGFFGTQRLQALLELFKDPSQAASVLYPNLFLSLLSVGGPIWFAWLSTKQIGQRFRLAEDYAYKASISRAYEGFRREAARIDPTMEARLLASALDRLDELPLRLVETETHGSPWNELANSELIKQALKTVPDFAGQVNDIAQTALLRKGSKKAQQPIKPSPVVSDTTT